MGSPATGNSQIVKELHSSWICPRWYRQPSQLWHIDCSDLHWSTPLRLEQYLRQLGLHWQPGLWCGVTGQRSRCAWWSRHSWGSSYTRSPTVLWQCSSPLSSIWWWSPVLRGTGLSGFAAIIHIQQSVDGWDTYQSLDDVVSKWTHLLRV